MQILTALVITMAIASGAAADLARYVQTDDNVYRWRRLSYTNRLEGTTVHELTLTSQVWQGITWQHRLRIVTPHSVQQRPSLAMLFISDSGAGERDLHEGVFMAQRIGAPVAILHDIPNQPLFNGLMEDDLLAHTFVKFLETHDPTWPLLLPMVKGAIKAMDATEQFMQQLLQLEISGFVVSGSSKRGWTTWLIPAVDGRVKAIVPLVYDNLNLSAQMQYQLETWRQFTGQISEYSERGLPQRLLAKEPGALALAALVDPFAYRARLTIPKLIILGTNDPYWPLDALKFYYDELLGKTYILYIPNAGHDLGIGRERVTGGMIAFFLNIAGPGTYPRLRWTFSQDEAALSLTIISDSEPSAVRAWIATSPTRDFRSARWEVFDMRRGEQGYVYARAKQAEEAVAIFGEAVYGNAKQPFSLSTVVRIFP